jgi:hypothetical protein
MILPKTEALGWLVDLLGEVSIGCLPRLSWPAIARLSWGSRGGCGSRSRKVWSKVKMKAWIFLRTVGHIYRFGSWRGEAGGVFWHGVLKQYRPKVFINWGFKILPEVT